MDNRKETLGMQTTWVEHSHPEAPRAKRGAVDECDASVDEQRQVRAWLRSRFAKAKKSGMFSEIVMVTPVMADVILRDHNHGNRRLRETRVSEYIDVIREGRWLLVSQGISFSLDDRLNNGQHRLTGIKRAGIAVQMNVTFGEARDAFKVLDGHGMRGGADALHVMGEANSTQLAAAARSLYIIERGGRGNHKVANDVLIELLSQHEGLRAACAPGHRLSGAVKCSAAGAAVAYYLIETRSQKASRLPEFWDRVCTGVGFDNTRDAGLILRNTLMGKSDQKKRNNQGAAAAANIITAWNCWSRGKRTQTVKWEDGQPYPEVM